MRNLGTRLLLGAAIATAFANGALAKDHNPQALSHVLQTVHSASEEGRRPVVVIDIDDTLINTRERNLRILKEFGQSPETQSAYPNEAAKISALTIEQVKYQSSDTLKALGINDESLLKAAGDFWLARFFTNEYCALDQPNPGAAKYVHHLVRAGAKVIYLTGRDVPRMHEGTASNLKLNRFPAEPGAILMMKPDPNIDDLQFKKDSFARISEMGEVVAAFENEPANLNAMVEAFPNAQAIFLDTIHSPKPIEPVESAEWVKDFRVR